MICYREFISMHRLFSSACYRALSVLFLVLPAIPLSPSLGQEHFQWQPGQAIDISSLPADVLNCDECRRRLGLPSLASNSTESKPQLDVKRMKPSLPSNAANDTKSQNGSSKVEFEVPVTQPAQVETKKVEPKKIESTKNEVKKVELPKDQAAETKPTLKQLGEPASQSSTKPSTTSDLLRIDGVLTSPATQRIEIEILKRQLLERETQLKQFGQMQANVEERIDQLVRMNEDLAKKNAGRQDELNRLQKSSEQALQARELELSNLRADLATVRADANEKTKRLHDQLLEMESTKAKEIAKLNEELIEAKQARIEAVANLRKELASSHEVSIAETARMMAEQTTTLESQKTMVRKLEVQLAKAEKAQRDDAERIAKLREELNAAFAARTKALEELAQRTIAPESIVTAPAKQSDPPNELSSATRSKDNPPMKSPAATKSKSATQAKEPAKTATKSKPPATDPTPNSLSVEQQPIPTRRAF